MAIKSQWVMMSRLQTSTPEGADATQQCLECSCWGKGIIQFHIDIWDMCRHLHGSLVLSLVLSLNLVTGRGLGTRLSPRPLHTLMYLESPFIWLVWGLLQYLIDLTIIMQVKEIGSRTITPILEEEEPDDLMELSSSISTISNASSNWCKSTHWYWWLVYTLYIVRVHSYM